MKTQTTKKAIMNAYRNVIKVGYCDLQDALKWREPDFYTAGVHGRNADVYVIDYDTVIVTGYRPFGNIELPREVIDALNVCAVSITHYLEYDMAKIYLNDNLHELASGIKYDSDNYVFARITFFASADENYKIKIK